MDRKHIATGKLGEAIAEKYLRDKGYSIIERNYRQRCGEIDIIAKKDNVVHFVEVKAGNVMGPFPKEGDDRYDPQDHMHSAKRLRLARTIEIYRMNRNIGPDVSWTCDLVVVRLRRQDNKARVRMLTNILL
jgi:putative endonuclease